MKYYKQLLESLKHGSHSQNEKKSAISDVLGQFDLVAQPVAEEFYKLTIIAIRDDERLWFDFSMELCHSYLEQKAWKKLDPMLQQMHEACQKNGVDDSSKADLLIQIYAVRIEQMFATGNFEQLDYIFQTTNALSANVSDHRSAPIIAEFRGKYFAEQQDFQKSYAEFFQAIKYGDPDRAKSSVKYLVCVTMLGEDNTNPFASREVKIYETHAQVKPIVDLYQYFQDNNIYKFDSQLKRHGKEFESDNFIAGLIPKITLKLRQQTLKHILRPYSKVSLDWLQKLYYNKEQTEQLLIAM
eukprot:UN31715